MKYNNTFIIASRAYFQQKAAARKSRGRKKMLLHSPHHHVKIARHLRWWRVGTKTRLYLHDGL